MTKNEGQPFNIQLVFSNFYHNFYFLVQVGLNAHGRLMDPPSRNAMWRFGFPNPVNYDDNEVFCGGYGGNTLMTSFTTLGTS